MRGHPQITVGDVLTELPTKLDVERKKEKRAKEKMLIICPIYRGQTVRYTGAKESTHILLSFLKITQFRRCDTAQGN